VTACNKLLPESYVAAQAGTLPRCIQSMSYCVLSATVVRTACRATGAEIQGNRVKEGSCSFLKKRTKKLSNPGPSLTGKAEAKRVKVFCFFFSKKKSLRFCCRPIALRGDGRGLTA
jgi:hypothetical protein